MKKNNEIFYNAFGGFMLIMTVLGLIIMVARYATGT